MYARVHARTCTHTHSLTHTRIHTRTHTHTHTHKQTRTHAHIRTHTCTHTQRRTKEGFENTHTPTQAHARTTHVRTCDQLPVRGIYGFVLTHRVRGIEMMSSWNFDNVSALTNDAYANSRPAPSQRYIYRVRVCIDT